MNKFDEQTSDLWYDEIFPVIEKKYLDFQVNQNMKNDQYSEIEKFINDEISINDFIFD